MNSAEPYSETILPHGVRSRFVDGINGLRMHVLEAGFENGGRPCVLLLHGFPELAFSWRKIMPPLAAAGYHVIAPDQRGYGRTSGWNGDFDADLAPYSMPSLVKDALALVYALGYRSVASVIGHDFGSPVAAWCALIRPDVFRSAVMMSAPFAGPPSLPFGVATAPSSPPAPQIDIHDALAALPRPRKHYQWHYSTPGANEEMWHCPQGVHAFLRAYYHMKSANWPANRPFRLAGWTAHELARMPAYYIMDLDKGMAETVAPEMPSDTAIAACRWLTEPELRVYSDEYTRNGFQGGLHWYRCMTGERFVAELKLFAGRTIDVPSLFLSGKSDWGVYQVPGALEKMQQAACTRMLGCHLIEGAGHWVQQEQPQAVAQQLLDFLQRAAPESRR